MNQPFPTDPPSPPPTRCPLSPTQRGILFEALSDSRPGRYVLQKSISVAEPLVFESWCDAWQAVTNRHEALRTGFAWEESEPQQLIRALIEHPMERIDWRDVPPDEVEARLAELRVAELRRPFDLTRPPLSRLTLALLPDDRFECLWTYHHVILDGRSARSILEEVFRDYDARIGTGDPLSPVGAPSPADTYRERARHDGGEPGRRFWRAVLEDLPAATPLPDLGGAGPAPEAQSSSPAMCEAILSREATDRLRDRARELDVTLHTLLQGAWAVLLGRHTGMTDVVFADTRAGRRNANGHACEAAGVFIATVPVRARVAPDKPIAALLTELRQLWLDMRPHELTPLPIILRQAHEIPEPSRLLDTLVMFEHQRFDAALRSIDARWSSRRIETHGYAVAPLAIAGFGEPELVLRLSFDRARYCAPAAERILAHLKTLLTAIGERTDTCIGDLAMIDAGERHLLTERWARAATSAPPFESLHGSFEAQVDRRPDAPAVIAGDLTWTYNELEQRANRLAHRLRSLGARPGDRIGVCLQRSAHVPTALLATGKAGAAFVPVHPDDGDERLARLFEQTGARLVLADGTTDSRLRALGATAVRVDDPQLLSGPVERLPRAVDPRALAYVLFTSGSTGSPRGVAIEQRSVVNTLHSFVRSYRPAPGDRTLQCASICFDVAINEIFGMLCSGGAVVIAEDAELRDIDRLATAIRRHAVTICGAAPSLLSQLSERAAELTSLRLVLSGGEELRAADVRGFAGRVQVVNGYGPTEAAICATSHSIDPERDLRDPIPIGRPILNTEGLVLGPDRSLVPVGCPGELYLGGAGLARGYLGDADATAQRFVAHPFRPGARLYRTGDRARWRVDGRLEFLGRMDRQVQIRGVRVEPAEIEAVLARHPGVHTAVVQPRPAPGTRESSLVAFVVPDPATAAPVRHFARVRRDAELTQGATSTTLPNGIEVLQHNDGETQYIYQENFATDVLGRFRIRLSPGAVVFDVGAHIGLFSLYVSERCASPRIFAVEPNPRSRALLVQNLAAHGVNARTLPCALSNADGEGELLVFEHVPAMAGVVRSPDELRARTEGVRESLARHAHRNAPGTMGMSPHGLIGERASESERIRVELRTLDSVVREHAVGSIDLVKLDVEGLEDAVLTGLSDETWRRVERWLIEVHHPEETLDLLRTTLQARGYRVEVDQRTLFERGETVSTMLAAVRPGGTAVVAATASPPRWRSTEAWLRDLRAHAEQSLARDARPSSWRVVADLPRNRNGKVDRSRLPFDLPPAGRSDEPPSGAWEELVAGLWCEVLGPRDLARDDDFFDLGGHSLDAMRVAAQLQAALTIDVPVDLVFDAPTIRRLAAELIERAQRTTLDEETSMLAGRQGSGEA